MVDKQKEKYINMICPKCDKTFKLYPESIIDKSLIDFVEKIKKELKSKVSTNDNTLWNNTEIYNKIDKILKEIKE